MTDSNGDLEQEIRRLQKELRRAHRTLEQIRRVAATSEELSTQSKQAMLIANKELQSTVEQLRSTTLLTEQASQAKSRFLATMSHEIRTPMNGVVGSLELLMRSKLDAEQAQLTSLMHGSAESLLSLINDILDFAKVESGKLVLEQIPFCLMDCVEGVVALESALAQNKGLEININVAPGLPTHFIGDPFRLRQVLNNLVSNAVKFTDQGEVQISVRHDPGGGSGIEFRVTDTGIGIRPSALTKIFDTFTQEDSGTTRRFGGSGLGLSICKHLVELMGSELCVESERGLGTSFYFCASLPTAEVTPRVPGPAPVIPTKTHDLSVLVVDDTPLNRVITSKMLRKLGCSVETADNGRVAVELVGALSFDLILMDCSMPVLDGYEATRSIRSLDGAHSRIPIVALTAYAMSEDRDRCLAAGMDDYVAKPVQIRELERVLTRFSRSSRSSSQELAES